MKWWAKLCAALGQWRARTWYVHGWETKADMQERYDVTLDVTHRAYWAQLVEQRAEYEARLAAKEQEIADLSSRLAAMTTPNKRPFCLFCDKGVHRGGEPYTVHSVIHKGCMPPTAPEVTLG